MPLLGLGLGLDSSSVSMLAAALGNVACFVACWLLVESGRWGELYTQGTGTAAQCSQCHTVSVFVEVLQGIMTQVKVMQAKLQFGKSYRVTCSQHSLRGAAEDVICTPRCSRRPGQTS